MQKRHDNRSRSDLDGRELARQLYGPPPPSENAKERVPFDSGLDFYELRRQTTAAGERYGEPYRSLLSLLKTCEPLARHEVEENRGASYKRLCAAAHMAGFSKKERLNLYWIAKRVSLSDRFAGHLIACLKRGGGTGDE